MTITRRRLIELGAGLACMAGLPAHAAPERLKEIRIGDSKGDWGLPTPWRHYPRGAGLSAHELDLRDAPLEERARSRAGAGRIVVMG